MGEIRQGVFWDHTESIVTETSLKERISRHDFGRLDLGDHDFGFFENRLPVGAATVGGPAVIDAIRAAVAHPGDRFRLVLAQ